MAIYIDPDGRAIGEGTTSLAELINNPLGEQFPRQFNAGPAYGGPSGIGPTTSAVQTAPTASVHGASPYAGAFKGVTFGATGAGAGTGAATAGAGAGAASTAGAVGGWKGVLIDLGANLAQSYLAKRAEKKAAEQQQSAAGQQAAAFAPYVAGGTQAFNTLAGLAGLSTGGGGMGEAGLAGRQRPPEAPVTGLARPRGGQPTETLATLGGGQMGAPGDPTAATQGSSYGGASVMLMAPNGQQMAVPQAAVDHYLQRGARRVGA